MSLPIDEFIGLTNGMSPHQLGVLMRILCAMWNERGFLQDDDQILARYAGVSKAVWKKHRSVVTRGMTRSGGLISYPWLLSRYDIALNRHETAKRNGSQPKRKPLIFQAAPLAAARAKLPAKTELSQNNNKQNQNNPSLSGRSRSSVSSAEAASLVPLDLNSHQRLYSEGLAKLIRRLACEEIEARSQLKVLLAGCGGRSKYLCDLIIEIDDVNPDSFLEAIKEQIEHEAASDFRNLPPKYLQGA